MTNVLKVKFPNIFLGIGICFLLLFSFSNCFAENLKEANFTIEILKDKTIIEATFPLTIKNAVQKKYPKVKNARGKEFEAALFKYVNKNLILYSSTSAYRLKSLKANNADRIEGKSYLLEYPETHWSVFKIKNMLMFNLNEDQINNHTLKFNKQTKIFTTTKAKPVWLNNKDKSNINTSGGFRGGRRIWRFALLLLIPLFGLIMKRFKNN